MTLAWGDDALRRGTNSTYGIDFSPPFTAPRHSPPSLRRSVRHAFIRLEKSGDISIRWWVDGTKGLSTRALIVVRPGESAFGLVHAEWVHLASGFVDLDDIAKDFEGPVGEN